jgi:hypothetical protein
MFRACCGRRRKAGILPEIDYNSVRFPVYQGWIEAVTGSDPSRCPVQRDATDFGETIVS